MRFPVTIRYRGVKAKIYGRTPGYPYYRVTYRAGGKRVMLTFTDYPAAKAAAERAVREIHKGLDAGLTPRQARDAKAATEALDELARRTGRRVSLFVAVREYVDAVQRLGQTPLAQAVAGYLGSAATVKRIDLGVAVREFITSRAPLTVARDGKRPQLSPDHHRISAARLEQLVEAMPGHCVCDLTREHLDAFMGGLSAFSPKTRNHYRAVIGQFFKWCVRKDYLPPNHRLAEAEGMKSERADSEEVSIYTPEEFATMLAGADSDLVPVLAIGGLAGLRPAEILRLDWADVWRIPGYIEVRAEKSKTRARRLVRICPALAAWLTPYRNHTGPVWAGTEDSRQGRLARLFAKLGLTPKKNGLRHSFCTYAYALHGERETAEQAGHSPAMLHAHYRGLATKEQAEAWFAGAPSASAPAPTTP